MKCPSCDLPLESPPLVPAKKDRRCTQFIECPCSALIRLQMIEGWDRWYAVGWWPNADVELGERRDLPGLEEFNDRYYGRTE